MEPLHTSAFTIKNLLGKYAMDMGVETQEVDVKFRHLLIKIMGMGNYELGSQKEM